MTDRVSQPVSLVGGVSSSMGERRRPGRPRKEAVRMPVRVEVVVNLFHVYIFYFFK